MPTRKKSFFSTIATDYLHCMYLSSDNSCCNYSSLVPSLLPLHAIIQRMTFDLPEREIIKLLCRRREEPGNEAAITIHTS